MTSIETTLSEADHAAVPQVEAAPVRVRIAEDLDAARADWLALEGEAPISGYQLFGWQRAFHDHLGASETPCIALLQDGAGSTQALLPFVVARHHGVATATFIGGKHANYGMGLWRPAFARGLTADNLKAALRLIARQSPVPIDLFSLTNQPRHWGGLANPFALLPHRPSPSYGYHLALGPDAEAVLERVVSSASRRKMRRKERALAEGGPLAFVTARDPGTIARFTDTFLAYKATRFAELGIANVFAAPGMRDFILAAAAGETPALELCALMVGDQPVALFAGTVTQGRYSGMFNAMIPGPLQKDSPGEVLLHFLIRDCCARGLSVFDLGAGEAGYKANICDGVDVLFDQAIPATAKGAFIAAALGAAGHAKRQVKQSPLLWNLVVKMRRLRGGGSSKGRAA